MVAELTIRKKNAECNMQMGHNILDASVMNRTMTVLKEMIVQCERMTNEYRTEAHYAR
jgi:hypothetical protein